MTLGEKIKYERKRQLLTQADIAGDRITRNMISLIEKDSANPSIDTLRYIADRLNLPLSYIISDDDDAFYYIKKDALAGIKEAYMSGNFSTAALRIERLGKRDDELSMILADSYLEIGKKFLLGGSLFSASKHLTKALEICDESCYNTDRIKAMAHMYLSVANNIVSPLLAFDTDEFSKTMCGSFDLEFFHYLTLNSDFKFSNQIYAKHLSAKKLMKEKDFTTALTLLTEADASARTGQYNAYAIFGIYSDLEICYKQLGDFEKAYKYSSKRFSLLEGFKA